MARGWTVSMGPSGGVLQDYGKYADIRFLDPLYDYGAAQVVLMGLNGLAAPAAGWAIRLIYDKGLATEQVHWEGIISAAEKKQEGNVYVIQAYTPDGLLQVNQTGGIRNYVARTPHSIIQAAPSPLLMNAQGVTVLPYGTSASVPNKVETTNDRMGSFSGTIANDQFVAHSKSLLDNVKRLCWQARYTNDGAPDGSSDADLDGSYGLEWLGRLEGANNSTPTFYLVKRRERAAAYTPELFVIPTNMHRSKRGNPTFSGADTVVVVGAGDGNTRIVSAVAGAGTRELVLDDKAIYTTVNANNFAQRALQVYGVTTEAVIGVTSRHNTPTRAGDTVTIRQTGHADVNLRVMQRFYDVQSKMFTLVLGRPQPKTRELLMGQLGFNAAVGTAPQFTDTKPKSLQSVTKYYITDMAAPVVVPASTNLAIIDNALDAVFAGSNFVDFGKCEELLVQVVIDVDAATITSGGSHVHTYTRADSVTIQTANSGNAGVDPHAHGATLNSSIQNTGNGSDGAPLIAGPFQLQVKLYFSGDPYDSLNTDFIVIYQRVLPFLRAGFRHLDIGAYPFACESPSTPGNFTPTRVIFTFRNDCPTAALAPTLGGTGARATSCEVGLWSDPLHRHNEVT